MPEEHRESLVRQRRLLDDGVALDAAQREGPRRGGGPQRVRALRPRAHLVRVRVGVRVRVRVRVSVRVRVR